jgi:ABC-2 type transport system ATP-binding protein
MSVQIRVRELRKRYDRTDAVAGVSFAIQTGEIFGLLGPNGAGKTTTLECLIGLREPDSGEMEICGIDVRRSPREVKQKIGVALQGTALQDKITPREALTLFGSFYRERSEPGVLLERFGLGAKADDAFFTLSEGQRQRLALALAFVNRPAVIFLDEPTAGLDPPSRLELRREIVRMKHEGHTVLLTTHDLEEAEQLCDRIAIIDHGRLLAAGAPSELIAESSALQTVALETSGSLPRERLAQISGIRDLQCDGPVVRFRTGSAAPALAALVQLIEETKVQLVNLQVRKATLEDIFLQLTGADRDPRHD